MLALITANLVPIVVAFLIGLVTARWAFKRPPAKPRNPDETGS
jgi:predicted permease